MPENLFLAALSAEELALLGPLEPVSFKPGDVLVHTGEVPAHFWFVERGFFSVARAMADGRSVEIAYIGHGGCMPVQSACNYIAQLPGTALRATMTTLRRAFDTHPVLRERVLQAGRVAIFMMVQSSACNALHSQEQRYARRLLAMSQYDTVLPATQQAIATALGISRQSATRIGRRLDGLVRRRRGTIEILDRAGLETRSCECHALIEAQRVTVGQFGIKGKP